MAQDLGILGRLARDPGGLEFWGSQDPGGIGSGSWGDWLKILGGLAQDPGGVGSGSWEGPGGAGGWPCPPNMRPAELGVTGITPHGELVVTGITPHGQLPLQGKVRVYTKYRHCAPSGGAEMIQKMVFRFALGIK